MLASAWLIPVLPFLAFWLIIFFGRRLPGEGAYVAIGAMVVDALWSIAILVQSLAGRTYQANLVWAVMGDKRFEIGYQIDPLTAVMLNVVTIVGSLIFIYSIGYMHGDPRYPRFFAYMALFAASMLTLVLANNLLLLYIGWEGVGLCSYLLIGFWFERPSAARASMKAFVTTRVGDLFMFIGILLIFFTVGSLGFGAVFEAVEGGALAGGTLTLAALLLFGGAVGKSAQIPLHVWLPDAMEGPTPVSALIHAATMVAAGVYLVARSYLLFFASPDHGALTVVAYIGGLTALMAATMGIVATDIKRVMAYSTISQLGYMMMGLGVGSIVAAIFHLFTHAFFKALLFLGAGSVNHATGTFDMRKMGGLARYMPVTFATTLVAGLALVGVFPLAGFWSKDEILLEAWAEKPLIFWTALAGVLLTAIYVGRMLFLTFGGDYKGGEPAEHGGEAGHAEPHESPVVMLAPLVVLAVLAATAGFANIGGGLGDVLEGWLPERTHELVAEGDFQLWISIVSVAVGLAGLVVAWAVYSRRLVRSESIRNALTPLPALLDRKYFLDELYENVLLKGVVLRGLATLLDLWDRYVVDGIVNGVATAARLGSEQLRLAQAGQAQVYGAAIFIGVVAAIAGILVVHP